MTWLHQPPSAVVLVVVSNSTVQALKTVDGAMLASGMSLGKKLLAP